MYEILNPVAREIASFNNPIDLTGSVLDGDIVNLIVSKWLTLIVRLSLVMLLIAWFYQNFYGVNLNQFFSATISIAATKPPIIWAKVAPASLKKHRSCSFLLQSIPISNLI